MMKETRFQIFSGANTNIWNDVWIPSCESGPVKTLLPIPPQAPQLVQELMDKQNHTWKLDNHSYKVDTRRISTFDRWIEGIISIPGTSRTDGNFLLSFLSFLGWEIWKARCKFVFNGVSPDPRLVITHARDACSEYLAVISKVDARGNLSPVHQVQGTRWSNPSPSYVKFNLDGSWLPGTMKGSIGIVSRNSSGD
ncbi:hypothetical protein GBA52_019110 [Prunus armeniaca]|nr:hypothetical protein GBA52_019110 [Prunus armeniaca]